MENCAEGQNIGLTERSGALLVVCVGSVKEASVCSTTQIYLVPGFAGNSRPCSAADRESQIDISTKSDVWALEKACSGGIRPTHEYEHGVHTTATATPILTSSAQQGF